MKIIKATVQNFKRIQVVQITPSGGAVEITGRNEQGKSSVLDAIEAALGGKRHDPAEPIRRGEEQARVVVDLGDLIVERVWSEKSDRLVVKNAEGATYGKAQGKLDELVGGLAFDPLGFMALKPGEQRAKLLELIGVDLLPLAARHAEVYQERRDVNRDHKQALARVGDPVEGAPPAMVDVADLQDKLKAAYDLNLHHAEFRRDAQLAQGEALRRSARCEEMEADIEQMKVALERAEKQAATRIDEANEAQVEADEATKASVLLEDVSTEGLQEEIDQAQELNALREKAQSRINRQNYADEVAQASRELTEELEAIEEEKAEALAGAKMPVDGLGITDDGVTYNGCPLEDEAHSRKVRVCTAIAAKLNPKLNIALVRQGNDLDDDNLQDFYDVCEDLGIQPWVERRSGVTEDALVIEAGRVAGKEG